MNKYFKNKKDGSVGKNNFEVFFYSITLITTFSYFAYIINSIGII